MYGHGTTKSAVLSLCIKARRCGNSLGKGGDNEVEIDARGGVLSTSSAMGRATDLDLSQRNIYGRLGVCSEC